MTEKNKRLISIITMCVVLVLALTGCGLSASSLNVGAAVSQSTADSTVDPVTTPTPTPDEAPFYNFQMLTAFKDRYFDVDEVYVEVYYGDDYTWTPFDVEYVELWIYETHEDETSEKIFVSRSEGHFTGSEKYRTSCKPVLVFNHREVIHIPEELFAHRDGRINVQVLAKVAGEDELIDTRKGASIDYSYSASDEQVRITEQYTWFHDYRYN